eukprot:749705-Hanusia_phi.AAC.2
MALHGRSPPPLPDSSDVLGRPTAAWATTPWRRLPRASRRCRAFDASSWCVQTEEVVGRSWAGTDTGVGQRSNRISGEGARRLFKAFKHVPELEHLDLVRLATEGAGVAGARRGGELALADEARQDWNSLGDEGAFFLHGGLVLVPRLRTLKMRCNEIDGKGAAILFSGLPALPSLRDLDL